MKYIPNNWVLLRIRSKEHEDVYKILAGWSGSYLSGESWKVNSGIKDVRELPNQWEVEGFSGSLYYCGKGLEHLSPYTKGILLYLQNLAGDGASISVVPMKEYMDSKIILDRIL